MEIINGKDAKLDDNTIIYDPIGNPSLPDIQYLLKKIIEVMSYMCEDSVNKLKINDYQSYLKHLEFKFSDFCDDYYAVFQKLISGDDIYPLIMMIEKLIDIKNNRSNFEDAEKFVGTFLSDSFTEN